MKYVFFSLLFLIPLYTTDSVNSWFTQGTTSGYIKYYYIETNKDYINGTRNSPHSNAIGGVLRYNTARQNGFLLNMGFMTTQGFLLTDSVESSTIAQDEGKKGLDATKGYAVLGEINLDYKNRYVNLWYGRNTINTPMIGPKPARMLPSTVEGAHGSVTINETTHFSLTYVDGFKQRSAKDFTNIIKHALGSDMYAVTGKEEGETYTAHLEYKNNFLHLNFYNMYAQDFINSAYIDAKYTQDSYSLSAQAVSQFSIGNADTNLANTNSVTNGKKINAQAFGLRGQFTYKQSGFDVVYRNILRDKNSYDSIITPWDGNLLYAYSSTTNNLGQSLYGNGLTAGGAYVGGTEGLKLGYTQKFTRYKAFKTHFAYAIYTNTLYRENQEDFKAILFYDQGNFSIQLKGIWINNDTYTFKDSTVNQLDFLTQYHGIITYKF